MSVKITRFVDVTIPGRGIPIARHYLVESTNGFSTEMYLADVNDNKYVSVYSSNRFGVVGAGYHKMSKKMYREVEGKFFGKKTWLFEDILSRGQILENIFYAYTLDGQMALKYDIDKLDHLLVNDSAPKHEEDSGTNAYYPVPTNEFNGYTLASYENLESVRNRNMRSTGGSRNRGMDFIVSDRKFTMMPDNFLVVKRPSYKFEKNKYGITRKRIRKVPEYPLYIKKRDGLRKKIFKVSIGDVEPIKRSRYRVETGRTYKQRLVRHLYDAKDIFTFDSFKSKIASSIAVNMLASFGSSHLSYYLSSEYLHLNTSSLPVIWGITGITTLSVYAAAFATMPRLLNVKHTKTPDTLKTAAKEMGVNIHKFGISMMDDVNAFAYDVCGIGWLNVSKGLIDLDDPRHLAGASFHEAGHIFYKAITKTMLACYLSIGSFVTLLTYLGPRLSQNPELFVGLELAYIPSMILMLKSFKIRQEYLADRFAAKNGFGQDLTSFFLAHVPLEEFDKTHLLFSHPSAASRVRKIRDVKAMPINFDRQKYKQEVKELIEQLDKPDS